MENAFLLRLAQSSDVPAIGQLFQDSVMQLTAQHYDEDLRTVWALAGTAIEKWQTRIESQFFYVADAGGPLAGFASLSQAGYVDCMFVAPAWQGQGVAKALLTHLEQLARAHSLTQMDSDVSITARPFFERMGFEVVREQQKPYHGRIFTNYIMIKVL